MPGCRTILCVVREVWKAGVCLGKSVRYFISSLDGKKVPAKDFLKMTMGHWQIENRLHLVKDRWWDEDKHVFWRPGLGEIWAAITDLVLSLLRKWQPEMKITESSQILNHKPQTTLQLLGF